MQRYALYQRWSNTNGCWGWVIWDTNRDEAASAWHRNALTLQPYAEAWNANTATLERTP